MLLLSSPQVWQLPGTWSNSLAQEVNLIGLSSNQLMMVLHSIFVPLVLIVGAYLISSISEKKRRKVS